MLDVGWSCPRCEVVLAPSVSEHRCAPPSAGVTTAVPHPPPYQPPSNVTITAPGVITATATTGHLGVASGYLTEVHPGRLEIAGGAAA